VAVVFVSLFDEEDRDQTTLDLPPSENALVAAVAAANPNTIVVLNTGSAVVMPWLGQVKGVLEAWYPGQEDGNAIAAILFGDADPSGRLPVTFPASQTQMPTTSPERWPGVGAETQYSEGLLVGYRWYDANHVTPAFPFGFGLSYTSFTIRDLALDPHESADGRVSVHVDVTNTGQRAGTEVVQLYLGDPAGTGEPQRQLAGFQKVPLAPGQTQRVTLQLDPRSLSTWDPALQRWKATAGRYRVEVGDSSSHLPVSGGFTLSRTIVSGTPTPPPPAPAASASTVGSDAATCWQDDLATLINGGLSLTGESVPGNPSQLPLG
jgi:beta-glucosidase